MTNEEIIEKLKALNDLTRLQILHYYIKMRLCAPAKC